MSLTDARHPLYDMNTSPLSCLHGVKSISYPEDVCESENVDETQGSSEIQVPEEVALTKPHHRPLHKTPFVVDLSEIGKTALTKCALTLEDLWCAVVETCERWRYVLAREIEGQSFPVGRRYQRSRLRPR